MDERELVAKRAELDIELQKSTAENERHLSETRANIARDVLQYGTRGQMLEGDEWKPAGQMNADVVAAAEKYLIRFFNGNAK